MTNILYIFISHESNIKNVYDRIKHMMNNINNPNYIIVKGGNNINNYDSITKVLSINCNDKYEDLPEKVLKTYKYLVESNIFDKYTHYIKLDDDMIVNKIPEYNIIKNLDYIGYVSNVEGNRSWHIGKCSKDNIWNNKPYDGIYVPWCLGGYGYILSRNAINLIKNDTTYEENIYEDLYIAILLENKNIYAINIKNWKIYCISPEHI